MKLLALTLSLALFAPANALAQGAPAAQSADNSISLAPSGPWTADFGDSYCALRRKFSGGSNTAYLELRQVTPNTGFEVTVASTTLVPQNRAPITTFLPDGAERAIDPASRFSGADGWKGFKYSDNPLPRPGTESDGGPHYDAYRISQAFGTDLVLQTGDMKQPFAVMNQCLDGLMTSLGLDPAVQRSLSQRAQLDGNASWLTGYQTVSEQVRSANHLARLSLLLVTNPQGKVTKCIANGLPPSATSNNAACSYMLDKATFDPARDAGGHPVQSYFSLAIQLPAQPPAASAQASGR